MSKRNKCTESDLLETLNILRKKRQANCSNPHKKLLAARTLYECADFLTPKVVTENERKGRSSGSLSWRLQRGERHVNAVRIIKSYSNINIFNSFFSLTVLSIFVASC